MVRKTATASTEKRQINVFSSSKHVIFYSPRPGRLQACIALVCLPANAQTVPTDIIAAVHDSCFEPCSHWRGAHSIEELQERERDARGRAVREFEIKNA
jgi:hypothetical protein